jgi:hypothetical protein
MMKLSKNVLVGIYRVCKVTALEKSISSPESHMSRCVRSIKFCMQSKGICYYRSSTIKYLTWNQHKRTFTSWRSGYNHELLHLGVLYILFYYRSGLFYQTYLFLLQKWIILSNISFSDRLSSKFFTLVKW